MDLIDLTEEQLNEAKNQLFEKEMIFECKEIKGYDAKFFETVTVSNTLIKFFLFFSMGIYILINLAGMIVSFLNDTLNNPIGNIVGLFAICFIVFAIFSNVNTNKKKEENALFIKDNNFIFNFTDVAVENPNLFFSLPYDSLKRLEFVIHKLKKGQIFGGVTFTFHLLDHEVHHAIRFTNLSKIKTLIEKKFPDLMSCLVIDGKGKECEPVKSNRKLKYSLISLAVLVASLLLTIIPYALNYRSIALIISAIVLFITAILAFLSIFIYTCHLIKGIIISSVFIIMGFCVPLLAIEISGISIFNYVSLNSEILLPTFFGIVGLCLYAYCIVIIFGKLQYKIKNKTALN